MGTVIWVVGGQVLLPLIAGGLVVAVSPRWPVITRHPILAAIGLFYCLVILSSLAGAGGDLWMATIGGVVSLAAAMVDLVLFWRRRHPARTV